jgi:hypothetical protein
MRAAGRTENREVVDEELMSKIIARCASEATPSMASNRIMAEEIVNNYQRIERQVDEGVQM